MIDNQSLRFLVPLLPIKSPRFYVRKNLIGAFIGDKDKSQWDGKLLLVYDYNATLSDIEFEAEVRKLPEFIGSYDYVKPKSETIMVYGFSIDSFKEDIEKVLEGKYSELSPDSKLRISKFWNTYSGSTLSYEIVEKHENMQYYWARVRKNPEEYCAKGELWYIPEMDVEIFNIEKHM